MSYGAGNGIWGLAVVMAAVGGLILWSIRRALSGKRYRLRSLAGVDALAEAVVRATELVDPRLG